MILGHRGFEMMIAYVISARAFALEFFFLVISGLRRVDFFRHN